MKRVLLLILTFGLFAGAAYAHNGMEHVMGTVTAMTDSSVSVKTMNGTVQTVALTGETKFLKGDAAITLKDIKVGDHIVIHAAKKEGKLVAAEVKVGAMNVQGTNGPPKGRTEEAGPYQPKLGPNSPFG
jgi:phosphomannomutase